jgi:hypothetical protein
LSHHCIITLFLRLFSQQGGCAQRRAQSCGRDRLIIAPGQSLVILLDFGQHRKSKVSRNGTGCLRPRQCSLPQSVKTVFTNFGHHPLKELHWQSEARRGTQKRMFAELRWHFHTTSSRHLGLRRLVSQLTNLDDAQFQLVSRKRLFRPGKRSVRGCISLNSMENSSGKAACRA